MLLAFLCLSVFICLSLCLTPEHQTRCLTAPTPPPTDMIGLLADIQQSISFVTGPGSTTSQEADRNTQPGQTLYISTLFFSTAVQINVKETLRKFNLVIVLASKPAVQRGSPFLYGQTPASVCENKWLLRRLHPKSILEWEVIISLLVLVYVCT